MAFGEAHTAQLRDGTPVELSAPEYSGLARFFPVPDTLHQFARDDDPGRGLGWRDHSVVLGQLAGRGIEAWGIVVDGESVGFAGLLLGSEPERHPRAFAYVVDPDHIDRGIEAVALTVVTHSAFRDGHQAVETLAHAQDPRWTPAVHRVGFVAVGIVHEDGFWTLVMPSDRLNATLPGLTDPQQHRAQQQFASKVAEYAVTPLGYI